MSAIPSRRPPSEIELTHEPSNPAPPQPAHRYDTAPGVIAIPREQIPALPDDIVAHPASGRLDPRAWFRDPSLPLELEIGCGKGTFILEESRARSTANFLGIEWEGEFFAYTCDRLRRAGVTNARMLHTDATEFLRWRTPDSILSVIHLYFSDPWPKSKHHKNRVVQHRFLAEAWRTLIPGGELRVVTDHDELWAWCRDRFATWTDAAAFQAWTQAGRADFVGTVPPSAIPPALPPFTLETFVVADRQAGGAVVGTNYERKMCADRQPHSCVLRKPRL